MGRAPCCDKNGLKKGPWIPEEDQKLIDYIQKHGYGNWRTLPNNAGLQRCGKSCRLRWTNYLKPDIKRGRFSFEEEETIIHLHSRLGNKWSTIAARLPGRTDNEIKNYWNTQIRKKLLRMGIDPVTHGPRLDLLELFSHIYGLSSLSNSPQMNLSRLLAIQPLVNPELLRLATSVLHNQCENDHNFVSHENGQENQLCNNPQVQNQYHHPLVQPNKLQEMPTCTTLTATSSNVVHFSNYKTQLTHPNANQNFGLNQEWQSDHGLAASNSAEDYVTYKSCYQSHDQTGILDPSTLTLICNNRDQNFSFVPVLSTPSSSSSPAPLNSNSTYINGGSSTEDERESYSSMLKYEIREILEASNNFMQLHDQPL